MATRPGGTQKLERRGAKHENEPSGSVEHLYVARVRPQVAAGPCGRTRGLSQGIAGGLPQAGGQVGQPHRLGSVVPARDGTTSSCSQPRDAVSCQLTITQGGERACAAWMPRSSLHGCIDGVPGTPLSDRQLAYGHPVRMRYKIPSSVERCSGLLYTRPVPCISCESRSQSSSDSIIRGMVGSLILMFLAKPMLAGLHAISLQPGRKINRP